jgi:hypothetical protein
MQCRATRGDTLGIKRCGSLITALIAVLDSIDPDPDLEPSTRDGPASYQAPIVGHEQPKKSATAQAIGWLDWR